MLSINALVGISQDFSTLLASNGVVAAAAVVGTLGAALYLTAGSPVKRPTDENGKPIKPRHVPNLPGSLPVLRDLLAIIPNMDRYHTWMWEKCQQFEFKPWRMKIPGQAELMIFSSPEQFEEVLVTQFTNFPKGEYQLDLVTTFFGRSLVGSDGERWHHQRKTAVKFFTARSLRAYMSTSAKRNLLQIMDIMDTKQTQGETVNLTNMFLDFTMQTFVETGLGVKLDWIGRETPHPFQQALDAGSELVTKRFSLPAWLWRMQRKLNIGDEAKLAKHMNTVTTWLTEIVNKSLEAGVAKKSTDTEAEQAEMKSMVELFAENSREDADGLRSEDLVDFIQVMVIAARDTTAIALTWFFYELSRNPHVEAKIRAEMHSLFPTRAGQKTNYFTSDEARTLVYLEAALKETLRLYPPAPFMFKETAESTVICGDIVLPKGQLVGLSMYSAARNTHTWGADAAEFNPDRWIDTTTGELKQFAASKFATFSAGPRSCVGMSLAMLELRVVAANLLSRFHFEMQSKLDGTYDLAALLVMKDLLIAKIETPSAPST